MRAQFLFIHVRTHFFLLRCNQIKNDMNLFVYSRVNVFFSSLLSRFWIKLDELLWCIHSALTIKSRIFQRQQRFAWLPLLLFLAKKRDWLVPVIRFTSIFLTLQICSCSSYEKTMFADEMVYLWKGQTKQKKKKN